MTNAQPSMTGSGGQLSGSTYLPERYCGRCMSLVYGRDARCVHCERRRPAQGWSKLKNSGDPWLGRIMHDRYLITRRLGKGATAMVYEAESLKIARQFAIKVVDLNACAGGKEPDLVRARLRREVEAIGRLRSPHSVPLFEVFELSESCVAVVMNFIAGRTLESVLAAEGRLDWRRACGLLRQMAIGVHDAHQCGLIHRDLKPANIMIEPISPGDEFVHLLDFGIVWIDDGVEMTRGFVGTPLYASPEQALGDEVDCRSDIYSLGAILFEMLTGRPPFRSDNVIEVLRMHVRNNPPTLAEASEVGDFPTQVQHLVERMLSKSREARPADLEEVIDAVDAILEDTHGVDPAAGGPSGERRVQQPGPSRPATLPVICAPPASADPQSTAPGLGLIESVSQAYASQEREAARGCAQTVDTVDSDPIFAQPTAAQPAGLDGADRFFESRERDATGPKAAIFHRRPSGEHRSLRPQ
ncbi:MAG: serine/threonine protein kinase [Persicimonas sp.]